RDGSPRVNVSRINDQNAGQLYTMLETNIGAATASIALRNLTSNPTTIRSPLEFFVRSTMSSDDFAKIADLITTTTNTFIEGRININSASAAVLTCIPGITNRAQDLASYRQSNPDRLTSIAWLIDALGLPLDGSRLDGVVLRRTNGSMQLLQSFSVALSLDPLTAAPELVGREIRNHLDAAGVRERQCVVCVPLKWALTAHTEMPDLP